MTATAPAPEMYRNSKYTVEEFHKLPIAERVEVNRDCDYRAKHRVLVPTPAPEVRVLKSEPAPVAAAVDFEALAQQAEAASAVGPAVTAPAGGPSGAVYETTDYGMFRRMEENRVTAPGHVRKLVQQIGKRNLLYLNPIHVTAQMEVVDGQHRLAAARELGVPIFYRVSEELCGDDIAMLNSASKNWAGPDYLHHWTALGKPDYQALTDFMARHPTISFSNAKNMLSSAATTHLDELKKGSWQVGHGKMAQAELVAGLIERIGAETSFKQSKDTRFVMAVHYCVSQVEGFDPEKFMEKILAMPRMLEPCATHKKYLEVFGEIYNYRMAAINRLRFE